MYIHSKFHYDGVIYFTTSQKHLEMPMHSVYVHQYMDQHNIIYPIIQHNSVHYVIHPKRHSGTGTRIYTMKTKDIKRLLQTQINKITELINLLHLYCNRLSWVLSLTRDKPLSYNMHFRNNTFGHDVNFSEAVPINGKTRTKMRSISGLLLRLRSGQSSTLTTL